MKHILISFLVLGTAHIRSSEIVNTNPQTVIDLIHKLPPVTYGQLRDESGLYKNTTAQRRLGIGGLIGLAVSCLAIAPLLCIKRQLDEQGCICGNPYDTFTDIDRLKGLCIGTPLGFVAGWYSGYRYNRTPHHFNRFTSQEKSLLECVLTHSEHPETFNDKFLEKKDALRALAYRLSQQKNLYNKEIEVDHAAPYKALIPQIQKEHDAVIAILSHFYPGEDYRDAIVLEKLIENPWRFR